MVVPDSPAPVGLAAQSLPPPYGQPPKCAGRGVGHQSVAGRYPARRQDRPAATRSLGGAAAGRWARRSAVGTEERRAVLVTGASGMLWARVAHALADRGDQ